MIVSRTPFRVSFFGGGTDYPGWYRQHGGAVISTTIDKYCYLSCRYLPPFFDYRYRVVWSKVENCRAVHEIEHPVVRCLIQHLQIDRGIEVHHVGDLPARSGMGSSSAFTVGLLHALHALQGRMASKPDLMNEAIHVEQDLLQEVVGSQDQASAAWGGFNKISFEPSGQIQVHPIVLRPGRQDELDGNLMLFYTGIVRTAAKVASGYVGELSQRRRQLRVLRDLVDEGVALLASDSPIDDFGVLLDEAWQLKRSLGTGVSNAEVDSIYARAREAGATGGKVLGAGGGGFLLLYVPRERQGDVLTAFPDLVHVPFSFESSGSQVIFYDREQDFSTAEAAHRGQQIRPFRELGPEAAPEPLQQPAMANPSGPDRSEGTVTWPIPYPIEAPVLDPAGRSKTDGKLD